VEIKVIKSFLKIAKNENENFHPLFTVPMKKGIKFLFRIRTDAYKKEKRSMKTNDEFVDFIMTKSRVSHIKSETVKKDLLKTRKFSLRITKVKLSTEEEEHLISNLPINEVNYEQIKCLYAKRWEIEKSFDVLKNKLNMENITGRSKLTVEQDFHSNILIHNILQDIKNESKQDIKDNKENKQLKYEYKPNMNILVGLYKSNITDIIVEPSLNKKKQKFLAMIEEIKKNLIAIIPNRYFERIEQKNKLKHVTNLSRNF
jgi:hypothetical protein